MTLLPHTHCRLITTDSVDMHMLRSAESKRTLERLVISRGRFKSRTAAKELSRSELAAILDDDVTVSYGLLPQPRPGLCVRVQRML